MPFPFTFSFRVPGLHNPFTAQSAVKPSRNDRKDALLDHAAAISRRNCTQFPPPRRASPSPSLSPFVPLNRKRGWVPSIPEPSQAATSAASTRGYLDTPAKYRNMAHEAHEQEFVEEMFAELPPVKRRRTLAGSIVSTALSAALIGTAVGLTVYRLWRDRGKEQERIQPLPPPYHPGDWVPEQYKDIQVTPPTPKSRKPRSTPSVRRSGTRHRRVRTRGRPVTPSRSVSPALMAHPPPEFDFVHVNQDEDEEEDEPEADEMDWIGDRLSRLIQEGHRALNTEVVVMSEAKEDEVDDGSGDWEEEQPTAGPSVSRRSSFRRTHRPRDIQPPSYSAFTSSSSPSPSPRKRKFVSDAVHLSPDRQDFSRLSVPSTPRRITCESSMDIGGCTTVTSSFKEDVSAWQSPELRESMERARAQYLQRRMGARS
ncbi:uncharacterized protein BJ212DRAFT_1351020 [Suillus subaureus]|uniref:Uncharacterized protein n=1 Tax=Suillus subaureus TaxID=48587 RepID=A0A9P7EBS9_9AGAM|nr:uncharacterized protein BJ212DRAFT_1351020 [Suillus subaureus]KAG1817126.1 hypothetical protein BJ212DRAFT_1351020 [Suillus subaureus]